MEETRRKVYCAGPMFSPAEKWEQERLARELNDAGFETFLPQRDGLEIKEIMAQVADPKVGALVMLFLPVMRKAVFALDLYQVVEGCDCVVFNMNGRVPDGGSVSEAASAHMAGKPVVLYKETPVAFILGEDNPMIDGLSYDWRNVPDVKDLPAAVRSAIEFVEKRNDQEEWSPRVPPVARERVERGRKIWLVMQSIESFADISELIEELPAHVMKQTPVEVDGRSVKLGDEFLLGHLKQPPTPEVEGAIQDLWSEFADEVQRQLEGATPT